MKGSEGLFTILNERFDHIYVITLKRSKDRHTRIRQVLRGLDYEIFWAVDGSKLNLDTIRREGIYDPELALKVNHRGRELVPGEIGCALSHLEVYKDILARDYRNALILEDDIRVDADTTSELMESLAQLPNNWDLLYLGYRGSNDAMRFPHYFRVFFAYPILSALGFKKYNAKIFRRRYPREYSENLQIAGSHWGTHAYAVTSSGAEKILKRQSPVSMAADNVIATMCVDESIMALRVKRRIFHQNRQLPTTIRSRYKTQGIESNRYNEDKSD
jgi:glycosyl transferase family 25